MFRRHLLKNLPIPLVIAAMLVAAALPVAASPPVPLGEKPTPEGPPPPAGDYVPGELLVKFKPTVGQLGAQNLLAAQGLQVAGSIKPIGVHKVKVKPGQELETMAALRRNPNVLYAEPNYIAHALDTNPNDYYYVNDYQWGLDRISAPAAWDIATGSSDVIIAIVDSGIDLDHPDLSCPGKLTPGYDFYNGDPTPDDDNSHGSHVAGIAAACTNNGTGVAGVSWGARLMPVKVLNSSGDGTYEDVAQGIIHATDNGAKIINLSLGGTIGSDTLANAVQYAYGNGVLVVAAAGNYAQSGNPPMYPAAYATTLAVAATGYTDNWATYSEHHPYVDVAAPGGDQWPFSHRIYSTIPGSYDYKYGTSMATPYVAGLAALIWSASPSLTRDQVHDIIQSTADDLGAPGKDNYFGHGRINAWRALNLLTSLQTFPDQAIFLTDDDSDPFPASIDAQVTTVSSDTITWTTTISPSVSWLAVTPPASGTVSAASVGSFTLVPTRPVAYGTYTTTVVVTGTLSSGATTAPATTEARISYLSDLHEYHLPIIFKNYAP